MHEDDLVVHEGLINELAYRRQPYENISVIDIFDWDAHMSISRRAVLRRNRFGSDGYNMSDTTFGKDPR